MAIFAEITASMDSSPLRPLQLQELNRRLLIEEANAVNSGFVRSYFLHVHRGDAFGHEVQRMNREQGESCDECGSSANRQLAAAS
jgi:hypothetical protein